MYRASKKSKEAQSSKCYLTQLFTELRGGDAKPQMSRKPYSLTQSLPWAHTVDLILPEELYLVMQQKLNTSSCEALCYSRVFMSLHDVLSGDFFSNYIKTGNIILRSSGRSLVDNVYYLSSGILHLELDRATYERCGLVGEAILDGGRKHVKQRFLVKVNLRLPSMFQGRKGFERVLRAAKEVLIGDEEWLFVDLETCKEESKHAIEDFRPLHYKVEPTLTTVEDILLPWMPHDGMIVEYDYAEALVEWLGLMCIDSPRIKSSDEVDPYICRYQTPEQQKTLDNDQKYGQKTASRIVHMRWHGFAHQGFVKGVFFAAEKAIVERQSWFALNVCGFEKQSYCALGYAGKDWLCWQCDG